MKKNARKAKTMNPRIRRMIGILSISILMLIAVQGTVAFRMVRTPSLDNLFDFKADGLQATLSEPNWDEDNALNIVPGSIIPKDPQITNTGDLDAWTAMKLTFCYGPEAGTRAGDPLDAGDLATVLSAITIDWNTTNWSRFDDALPGDTQLPTALSQTFFYHQILGSTGTTAPLFTVVTIKTTNTEATMMALKAMGGFQIFVEGCAVQSEVTSAMTDVTAQTAFSFSNTPGP
jgi:hypothetical protein